MTGMYGTPGNLDSVTIPDIQEFPREQHMMQHFNKDMMSTRSRSIVKQIEE